MTLHEIEETVLSLSSRHAGLNEGMLETLLRAGGWEDKDIKDAKVLFREGKAPSSTTTTAQEAFHEELALPDGIEESHLLTDHNDAVPALEEVPQEKESLITENVPAVRDELPHNLPLRPFETSEHVWPFSRYRDVFYGDTESAPQPTVAEVSRTTLPKPEPVTITIEEKTLDVEPVTVPTTKRSAEDHLVLIASCMLVLVLFILGYMYQNGRF